MKAKIKMCLQRERVRAWWRKYWPFLFVLLLISYLTMAIVVQIHEFHDRESARLERWDRALESLEQFAKCEAVKEER